MAGEERDWEAGENISDQQSISAAAQFGSGHLADKPVRMQRYRLQRRVLAVGDQGRLLAAKL